MRVEAEAAATPMMKTASVLPDIKCSTCSAKILGRHIPLRAVQVYHAPTQSLRPVRDTTSGNNQDEWTNRPHYRGNELIINSKCLASLKVICALCLDNIWPAEMKVMHLDPARSCVAAFHLDCLDSCRLDAHRCPVCWQPVTEETEEETERKLEADNRIRKGLQPPRHRAAGVTPFLIQHASCVLKWQSHPQYYDLDPHKGPSPDRAKNYLICCINIQSDEATWIQKGQCNNSFHQDCLPGWIEYKKAKQADVDDDKEDEWRPDCPICRMPFMERLRSPGWDAVELGDSGAEMGFENLPEDVQLEVLRREEERYDRWLLVIWTDRLRASTW